jgi:predicted membrane metal-binding protein
MRSLVILVAGVFSFFYIDLRRFRKSYLNVSEDTAISIELSQKSEKLKRKQRQYKNKKYKKRRSYQQKHYKLKGTKSKDSRYSNQKDIRRMHTSYA